MATAIGTYATATLLKQLIGITDASDDTLIGLVCDRINSYIEDVTQRVIAPVGSATFLLDGTGWDRFHFPRGVRAISLLEYATATGGSYTTLASTEYFIRPAAHDRVPGWPGMWVKLSNIASTRQFYVGFDTIRMTGTTGWEAIPDDITELALVLGQRAWNARQQGFQDIAGVDEMGRPVVARFLSGRDRETLKKYTIMVPPG